MKRREPCPNCESDDTARIVYGDGSPSVSQVEVDGSVIGPADPHRACSSCGAPSFPDGRYLDRWEDEIFETVVLVRSSSPDLQIRLQAEIGEDETLRIAGHETGLAVMEVWGAHYEYWLTVDSADLTLVTMLVLQDLASLPSALTDFLQRYAISYEFAGDHERSAGTALVTLLERPDRLAVMLRRSDRFELRRLCLLGLRELFAIKGWETTDGLQALLTKRGVSFELSPQEGGDDCQLPPDPYAEPRASP